MVCPRQNLIAQLDTYQYCAFHSVFHILFRSDGCVRTLKRLGVFDQRSRKSSTKQRITSLATARFHPNITLNSITLEDILKRMFEKKLIAQCPMVSKGTGYYTINFFQEVLSYLNVSFTTTLEDTSSDLDTPFVILTDMQYTEDADLYLKKQGYSRDACIIHGIFANQSTTPDTGHAIAGITCNKKHIVVDSNEGKLRQIKWEFLEAGDVLGLDHYEIFQIVWIFVKNTVVKQENLYIKDPLSLIEFIFEGKPSWAVTEDGTTGKFVFPSDPEVSYLTHHDPKHVLHNPPPSDLTPCKVMKIMARKGLSLNTEYEEYIKTLFKLKSKVTSLQGRTQSRPTLPPKLASTSFRTSRRGVGSVDTKRKYFIFDVLSLIRFVFEGASVLATTEGDTHKAFVSPDTRKFRVADPDDTISLPPPTFYSSACDILNLLEKMELRMPSKYGKEYNEFIQFLVSLKKFLMHEQLHKFKDAYTAISCDIKTLPKDKFSPYRVVLDILTKSDTCKIVFQRLGRFNQTLKDAIQYQSKENMKALVEKLMYKNEDTDPSVFFAYFMKIMRVDVFVRDDDISQIEPSQSPPFVVCELHKHALCKKLEATGYILDAAFVTQNQKVTAGITCHGQKIIIDQTPLFLDWTTLPGVEGIFVKKTVPTPSSAKLERSSSTYKD